MDKKTLEEQKAKLETQYEEIVNTRYKPLVKTHTRKDYTFTIPEKRRIIQLETITFLANQAVKDIIDFSVLPRLGMIRTIDNSVFYDATLGKFTVFMPREKKSTEEVKV